MSEAMVVRVAKAIFAAALPDESDRGAVAESLWLKWHDEREKALGQARAAIQAMREPTEAMVRAAHSSMVRENSGYEYSVTVGHRAMIDAALAPDA